MFQRLPMKEYLRVLIPLLAIFAVYRFALVPIIEPPPVFAEPQWQKYQVTRSAGWWESEFPPDSWQRNQPGIIQTADCVLLFQKMIPVTEDRIELTPLTILLRQSVADGLEDQPANDRATVRRPTIIYNEEGAEIQFSGPLDLSSGNPPSVIGGRLRGNVTILGPASTDSENDSMEIETRNLFIDRRVVRTTSDVSIRLGDSYFDGRDLSIFLDQGLLGSQPTSTASETPFDGLDRLEMAVVNRMHIDLPGGGFWTPKNPGPTNSLSEQARTVENSQKLPAVLEVTCGGALQFDFHASIASLGGGVITKHRVQGQPVDQFDADQIRLHFLWHDPSENDQKKWSVGQIEADGRVAGSGSDPSNWVTIQAPGLDMLGKTRQLRVDLVRGTVFLSNRLSNQQVPEAIPVYLKRESLEVWAPELFLKSSEIANAQSNSLSAVETTTRFGTLDAAGPGQAKFQSKEDEWKVAWANRLQFEPDQELDRLTIRGGANVRSEQQGRFMADTMTLWLKTLDPAQSSRYAIATSKTKSPEIIPTRLHATGDVVANSKELRARVQDLQVWFLYPFLENIAASANPQPVERLQILDSAGTQQNVISQTTYSALNERRGTTGNAHVPSQSTELISHPYAPGPGLGYAAGTGLDGMPQSVDLEQPNSRNRPISITGENLKAKLVYTGTETLIDDLLLSETVTLTKDAESSQGLIPLTLSGKFLRLRDRNAGETEALITGAPAQIRFGSGMIQGPEIVYDETTGIARIDHPGEMIVPVELLTENNAMHQNNSSGLLLPTQSQPDDWLERPRIIWKDSLIFDGQKASFYGGTVITGRLRNQDNSIAHFSGQCDAVDLFFSEPVSLSEGGATSAELLVLTGDVDFLISQTDLQNNILARQRINLPQLNIELPTKQLVGQGPGWIRSRHRRNTSSQPLRSQGFVGNSAGTVGGPAPEQSSGALECLHLVFAGEMLGFLDRKEVQFHRSVEALIGPIATWEDTIDVRNVRSLSAGQSLLTCEAARYYSTADLSWNRQSNTGRNDAWELEAAGNVRFDSDSANAYAELMASRVVYAAERHTLHIEGSPAQLQIRQKAEPGARPSITKVRYAEIDLERMEPKNMQLTEINFAIPQADPAADGFRDAQNQGDYSSDTPIPSPRPQLRRP